MNFLDQIEEGIIAHIRSVAALAFDAGFTLAGTLETISAVGPIRAQELAESAREQVNKQCEDFALTTEIRDAILKELDDRLLEVMGSDPEVN